MKASDVFPMHDAILASPGMFHPMYEKILCTAGVRFLSLVAGQTVEL